MPQLSVQPFYDQENPARWLIVDLETGVAETADTIIGIGVDFRSTHSRCFVVEGQLEMDGRHATIRGNEKQQQQRKG